MSEDISYLILEHLRVLRAGQDRTAEQLSDVVSRLSSLEAAVVSIKREMVDQYEGIVLVNARLDRMDQRLSRIEKRLELTV